MSDDYYKTLGVERDATQDQIRTAYRKACRDNHPDRCEGGGEKMAAINVAYDTLSDPELRSVYDAADGEDTQKVMRAVNDLLHGMLQAWIEHDGEEEYPSFVAGQLDRVDKAIDGHEKSLKKAGKRLRRALKVVSTKHMRAIVTAHADHNTKEIEDLANKRAAVVTLRAIVKSEGVEAVNRMVPKGKRLTLVEALMQELHA